MAPTTKMEVQDGIAVITLSNPPVNALHPHGQFRGSPTMPGHPAWAQIV